MVCGYGTPQFCVQTEPHMTREVFLGAEQKPPRMKRNSSANITAVGWIFDLKETECASGHIRVRRKYSHRGYDKPGFISYLLNEGKKKTASAETTATVAYRKHIKRGSSSLVLVFHHIQQQEQ